MAEESSGDDSVKRALTLGPQQIAVELETAAKDGKDTKKDGGGSSVSSEEKGP